MRKQLNPALQRDPINPNKEKAVRRFTHLLATLVAMIRPNTMLAMMFVAAIFTAGCGKVVPAPNTPPPGNNQAGSGVLEAKQDEPKAVKVKGADKKLTVKAVEADKATFEFEGKPAFTVNKGKSQKVDLDGDGKPDVEVKLGNTNPTQKIVRVMVTDLSSGSATPPGGNQNSGTPGANNQVVQGHPDLLPVKDWREYVELIYFVDAYTRLVINKTFTSDAREGVKGMLTRNNVPGLFNEFETLFKSYDETMKEAGTKVPAKPEARMEAYLKAKKCERAEKKITKADGSVIKIPGWSDSCAELLKKIFKVFDDSVVLVADPTDDFVVNAKHLRKTAEGYEGGDAITLAHGALALLTMALPDSKRFWALSNSLLKGKGACYYVKKDNKWLCGPIEKVEGDGITINGQKITFSQMDAGDAMFCKGKDCDKMGMGKGGQSYAAQNRFSVAGRGVMRIGNAEGYEGFQSNTGAMIIGRFNIVDYLAAHAGFGAGGLTGKPTVGVTEQDSRTAFMGLVGLSFSLGDRYSWPLLVVLEANMTFQQHPGAEAAVGVELFPDSPFDLRILGTAGLYTTGKKLYSHPDFELPTYILPAGGLVLEAGGTLPFGF